MILEKKPVTFPKNIFLASLPLLFQISDFSSACFLGALVCAAYWVTALFFGSTQPLFPKPVFKTAILLWIASLAQMAWYVWNLKPFWVLSLALLVLDIPFKNEGKRLPLQSLFLQGISLWAILVYVGIFQEVLGQRLSFVLFQQAPGAFVLLSSLAFLWQLKRRGRSL